MKSLVLGAGGFIGNHMVSRLKSENHYVVAVDLKKPEFSDSLADEFYELDLTIDSNFHSLFDQHTFNEIYQYAADMGGAGYIFTGEMLMLCITQQINLNILNALIKYQDPTKTKYFTQVPHVFILKKFKWTIKI